MNKTFCELDDIYGDIFDGVAVAFLVPVALYRIRKHGKLTMEAGIFSFITAAMVVHILLRYHKPSWYCSSTPMTTTPSEIPSPSVEPPPPNPVMVGNLNPNPNPNPNPKIAPDPRVIWGNMDGLKGRKATPFVSNRGYSHYMPMSTNNFK